MLAHGKTRKLQHGATMLETLLASAIAAVLTTAAVPAMTEGLARQRLGAATSDLFATFNMARSEAIRRGSPVAVAPADAQNWSTGWQVFVDRNDNGVRDEGEEKLLDRPPTAAGLNIQPFFGATYSGKVLSYSAEGRLHRPGKNLLVIGRLVLTHQGLAHSLCFASLGVRIAAAATCE